MADLHKIASAMLLAGTAALAGCAASPSDTLASAEPDLRSAPERQCDALAKYMAGRWPEAGTRLTSSVFHEAGPMPSPSGPPGMQRPPVDLPAHCEITGIMHERTGVDGQNYAIRFHMRLPAQWSGRLLFTGGGGTNGNLGDAFGFTGGSVAPALAQGFAVLSQDSGHSNEINSQPDRGGDTAFGFDPQARRDYGGASLKPVTLAAKALIRRYYGADPHYSYFFGCSKGGQEGMALAQQYPELYDGIVAAAPGFSLPRAAVAEAWNTQAYAGILEAENKPVTLANLASTFTTGEMGLVRGAILDACDADDGAKDGMVNDYAQCTSAKVVPSLKQNLCKTGGAEPCLTELQIDALEKVHQGPQSSAGEQLYPGAPWDAGWGDMGWRIWHIGTPDGNVPAINVAMGAPSLAIIFSTPPHLPGTSLPDYLAYQQAFDFDRDTAKIYATNSTFTQSAWDVINARSSDLSTFQARGGKLIVPHGLSDPVFSINDTLQWWNEVNHNTGGKASSFARVFPVPGMAHCQGGPATDQYDALSALVDWVETDNAPQKLVAKAGPATPWPGRSRPICAYPLTARPAPGKTSGESADDFVCVR
ncbi:tannase/feruloyl esterase family alpha/beta hydrolase [Altericroceibacterium endophyticum]|uniref:Tannase/feruloyl esterase family alpha/beta hydrolase n=1 Tax=Altericroceibacterium endophyticum TaxID=1808508 RepID=A0A6I4T5B2_9SPHN|nr:tannase/feruloyl esterase family alpha/beta hydrolase [Altericroceibacterium endophyticum]MXO66414.1 tannase/feruloyl esterase family alpha/beta hydrolase [Altericroceibacterium endophyticum]